MRIARNTFSTWAGDRTTLSGSIPASLPAEGRGAAPCVRLLDAPAQLCGQTVRRAGPARRPGRRARPRAVSGLAGQGLGAA